jgi:hypothetical protein
MTRSILTKNRTSDSGSSFSLESNKNEAESSCMDREQIEGSAEKAKGTFEDTAGKVTDDKKLLEEVESRTTSRHLYCRDIGASSPRVRRPCRQGMSKGENFPAKTLNEQVAEPCRPIGSKSKSESARRGSARPKRIGVRHIG